MPVSPSKSSARLSPANGPTSSWSTGTQQVSTRSRSRERRCWRRGSPERKYAVARLALHRLSAGNEHRRSEHLRQLLGQPARCVPEIKRHSGAAAAFEEARDRRIAIGPVGGEDLDARLFETVTNLRAVDRGGFVD